MKTVKFVKMPGEVREFVVSEGTTARELLEMAGVSITEGEMDIRGDEDKIGLDTVISSYNLVSVAKRLKGATA